jgi:hypothetical protein
VVLRCSMRVVHINEGYYYISKISAVLPKLLFISVEFYLDSHGSFTYELLYLVN